MCEISILNNQLRCSNCGALVMTCSQQILNLDRNETNYGFNKCFDVEVKCQKCGYFCWGRFCLSFKVEKSDEQLVKKI